VVDEPQPRLSADVIEEAIMAFDAGNHAWGRYRHFVLPASPAAHVVSTAAVRDALAEAAICVIDAQAGGYGALLEALRRTLDSLIEYRSLLPEGMQQAELEEAAAGFDEAIVLLAGAAP